MQLIILATSTPDWSKVEHAKVAQDCNDIL
jgi:hypothetical protein